MILKSSDRQEMRDNAITIPMTAELRQRIKEAAQASGLTMSAYVRIVMASQVEKSDG